MTALDQPHPVPAREDDIGREKRLGMYRMLNELRFCEKRAYDLFLQNLVKGTSHLSLGQEAVAAGFAIGMRRDDYTYCTYRGHAHTLARGASMVGVLGELMGRECGVTGGKGGSMHLTSVEHGAMGSYAIIGAHMTIANGAAWSAQYRGTEQVAVCFFGDGTTNIGAFHEALNFAVIWKLPVVFVCENNMYMEYTNIHDVTAVEHPASDRAAAYGLEPVLIDGNDVEAVYEAAAAAAAKGRSGGGATFLECITYRWDGHFGGDPGTGYRSKDEIEAWKQKCPIKRLREKLIQAGNLTEREFERISAEVYAELEEIAKRAEAAPLPKKEIDLSSIYATTEPAHG